jgi:DNA-binding CsgD family transcriptional regulator/tetratricopeptide (TPR) repeat protein
MALVVGEAGIGKSRLLREMGLHPGLSGRRMLLGHCHRLREPFPLGPIIEALREAASEPPTRPLSAVVGALRPLLPEFSRHLPPRLDPLADRRAERHRVFRALSELLGALGECVCVLEDLHWADEGTLEFLSFLVSEQPESLALVLTYRDEQLEPSSVLRTLRARPAERAATAKVDLAPLAPTEVRLLASAILEVDVPEEFATSLQEWTAGIPLAVEEILSLLGTRGYLDLAGREPPSKRLPRLAVPSAVGNPILERMRPLSCDAKLIIRAAAVIERPVGDHLMRKVAGLSPLRGAKGLSEALSAGLLESKDEALSGFRHGLAARTVYEQIPAPERRRLHLRAARALEAAPQPRPLAQLAHHFKQAGRRTKWLRYTEATADVASSVGDDRAAAELLEEALSAPHLALAPARRMALKLGSAALFGRTPQRAIPFLEAALADSSLPTGLRGEIRLSLARLLSLVAEGLSSKQEMVRASEELRRRPALAARAMASFATPGSTNGDEDQQGAWLERALAAAARQDEPTIKTHVLATQAAFLLTRADPAGWRALDDLPWTTTAHDERVELVRASKYCAQATLAVGHYHRAELLLDQGEGIRRELGHQRFAVGLASVRAALEWRTGRWQGLEDKAQRLIEASAEAPGMSASNELILAWLLLARGEVKNADARLASLLETVRRARLTRPLATVASVLAMIRLENGDARSARELTATGLAGITEAGIWACASTVAPVAVDALIACDEKSAAEEVVEKLAKGLRNRDAPAASAALAHCRGLLAQAEGRRDPAIRWFASAERAWRALPSPYEAARARERRGRCLLTKDESKAASCLVGALGDFHALGASWDAARVRGALRAQGVSLPRPWGPGRKPYGEELSPREAEVARLAAMRRTNGEIAGELFISERTVEKHVSSALRKLGLTSREEIAGTATLRNRRSITSKE